MIICSSSIGSVSLSNPAALGILREMSNKPLYHKADIRPLHRMPQKSADGMSEANSAEFPSPNVHKQRMCRDHGFSVAPADMK